MKGLLGSTALAVALLAAAPAAAKDHGVWGATFALAETDLLTELSRRLKAAEASGRMGRLNTAFAARVKQRLERPPPAPGVARTTQPRSWLFDPTIRVPRDFADANGRVFAKAGELINPLDRIPGFDRVLIFIDGDDPRQVAFALRQARLKTSARSYIVLTSGAPLALMRETKVQVYFDQEGLLTRRLGIRQVPAVVAREGRALRVSERRP